MTTAKNAEPMQMEITVDLPQTHPDPITLRFNVDFRPIGCVTARDMSNAFSQVIVGIVTDIMRDSCRIIHDTLQEKYAEVELLNLGGRLDS